WKCNYGINKAPHREGRFAHFYMGSHNPRDWYFKDKTDGQVGGLAAFVMLAGMDAETANRWLVERWEAAGSPIIEPEQPANGTKGTKGNGYEAALLSQTASTPVACEVLPPTQSTTASPPVTNITPFVVVEEPRKRKKNAPQAQPPGKNAVSQTPVPQAPPSEWSGALKNAIVSTCELQQLDLPPRPRLLGDWFCEGDLGFIFAFRGVGKTWLGMLIARAVSEGGSVGEWQAPAPAPVLYIDGEMPPDLMRARDRGLARGTGNLEYLNHEILFRRTHRVMNITHSDVQQAILQRCEETGVKLVILDNLSTLASGMKENDADDWDMVGRWLLDFRRRQIAVIVIHHAGRNGEMRGTTKREDDAFWIIALEDARQGSDDRRGARFVSRFTKQTRNTPEEIPPYEWHISQNQESGLIEVTHKLATGTDMLRRLVEQGVSDCTDLAEELGVSKGTVSKWAHRGVKEGWLDKEGRAYILKV
ncbi:MAG TPA: AAA family ATPase, partial [Chthoniobacteraceae bacterium]|nr:AAA family ATPase [Chthoniobacteraceae bacterium]